MVYRHEPPLLVFRHEIERVRHLERHEDLLVEVVLERQSRGLLHQPAEPIDARAVVPARTRIEQQRPDRIALAGARLEIAQDVAGERIAEPGRVGEEMLDRDGPGGWP